MEDVTQTSKRAAPDLKITCYHKVMVVDFLDINGSSKHNKLRKPYHT